MKFDSKAQVYLIFSILVRSSAVALLLLSYPCMISGQDDAPDVVCLGEHVRMEVAKDGKEGKQWTKVLYSIEREGRDSEGLRSIVLPNSFSLHTRNADVRVWNSRGMRLHKQLGEFEDVAYQSRGIFISDTRYWILELPPLKSGDTLEVKYELKIKPFLGFPVRTFPSSELKVLKSVYQVKIPSQLSPRFQTWNGLGDPQIKNDGDKVVWTWSMEEPAHYVREPLGPPAEDILPTLSIGVNRIAWGPADSWEALAGSYWNKAEGQVRSLAESPLPPRQELQASTLDLALNRIQNNVRYVAIELGEGGLIPHSADETVRRKYGDCKDMATAVLSLLDGEETEGALAAVRTRSRSAGLHVDPLPTLRFFNHMVVYARDATGDAWLDATHPYATAANPRSDIQGAAAFVVSGSQAGFHRIGVTDPEANQHRTRIRLTETSFKAWTAEIVFQWTGSPAQDLIYRLESGAKTDELVNNLLADLEISPRQEISKDEIRVTIPSSDALEVALSFPIRSPTGGERTAFRPCWSREPYPLNVFTARTRETDVYWPLPGVHTDTLIVESAFLPLADLPDSSWGFEGEGLAFKIEQSARENSLCLVRTSVVSGLAFPAASWSDARRARGKVMRWSSQNLLSP